MTRAPAGAVAPGSGTATERCVMERVASRGARVVAACSVIFALVACGPRPAPHGVSGADAVLTFRTNVADASVYVDGRYVGPVNVLRGGVAVDPGKHRVELRHEDYFSRYLDLELRRAERRRLELPMAPILP